MKGIPPLMKFITEPFNIVVKFFDQAYEQGWLLYLIAGLIMLVVVVIFFS